MFYCRNWLPDKYVHFLQKKLLGRLSFAKVNEDRLGEIKAKVNMVGNGASQESPHDKSRC